MEENTQRSSDHEFLPENDDNRIIINEKEKSNKTLDMCDVPPTHSKGSHKFHSHKASFLVNEFINELKTTQKGSIPQSVIATKLMAKT